MKENYPSFTLDEKRNIKPSDIVGKRFVLIDDNSTTGRTFVGLKNFIEENGGEVVGYYALTTGQDQSEKMITTDGTWNKLLNLGIGKVRNFAEKEGIKREISKHGLTEREAQELIKRFRRKNVDSGRGFKNVERSGRGGGEIHSILETEKKDGRAEERLNEDTDYSLKGTSNTTSDGAKKLGVSERLAKYAKEGLIPTEVYNELIEEYGPTTQCNQFPPIHCLASVPNHLPEY